jgi:hypothetical protein
MARLELLLAEFPTGAGEGVEPRLLGRLRDADLVDLARERIAAATRRRLRRLERVRAKEPPP